MRTRAFSLLETLIVLAIILIMAAMMFPALMSAKRKAKETVCTNNLKQIHVAIERHRSDNEHGMQGSASQVGLPPSAQSLIGSYGLGTELFRCQEAPNGAGPGETYVSMWTYNDGGKFEQEYGKYAGRYVMVVDMNHNPQSWSRDDASKEWYGIGLTLDGSVIRRRRIGDWTQQSWWQNE